MGKRSSFKHRKQDKYYTPEKAVLPLLPHIQKYKTFTEPCAGDGRLVKHLIKHDMVCYFQSDIEPDNKNITQFDALDLTLPIQRADCVITNPPWTRELLHPMIEHFRMQAPTWLLFDADWMHTKQAIPYLKYCEKIVSVGRISWMENGIAGKDNCAWYFFTHRECDTQFYSRK